MKKIDSFFVNQSRSKVETRLLGLDVVVYYDGSGLINVKIFPGNIQWTAISTPKESYHQKTPCQDIIAEKFLIKTSQNDSSIDIVIYQR